MASSGACDDIHQCRTPYDIVWGCLVTIFACVWVSVHPNLPPLSPLTPRQSTLSVFVPSTAAFRARLKLMLVGVLAPELIAGFAGRQRSMAQYFSRTYNVSMTHGFFICMGGFVDSDGHPLVTQAQLNQKGTIAAIRAVDAKDIEDKSKGDGFTKGVAFSQGLWFVVQTLARVIQRLPVTQLEVATAAFAAVSLCTWALWWHKPLDVREPIVIGVAAETSRLMSSDNADGESGRIWTVRVKRTLRAPLSTRYLRLIGFSVSSKYFDPTSAFSVPTFWFADESDDQGYNALFAELLVAAVFGAIHIAAWNAHFLSAAETWLWRAAALALTGVPVLALAVCVLDMLVDFLPDYKLLFVCTGVLYVPARAILIVLPFVALRKLSQAYLMDVDWSIYIPHW
ncbi:hypothetical protein MIND_00635500 [Mycena indigotica]|uniref:Uncharacterized protein n=1 Tax=Mycena indigotica TaxID=2126181 RepID=A0A8H6SSF1_9AGAR|nr:uncharacterized protein MIND_00635500 [Mycena indigotica]KAF7304042.1 hypothetical protein MIND_00635500 [Mycena indigotica]